MQFTFDPIKFLLDGAQLAPAIIFVVIGSTYLAGKLGLKGNNQLAFAILLGAVLGAGSQLALQVPQDFAGIFALIVYALVMAITPAALYEQAKELLLKIVAKAFGAAVQAGRAIAAEDCEDVK